MERSTVWTKFMSYIGLAENDGQDEPMQPIWRIVIAVISVIAGFLILRAIR